MTTALLVCMVTFVLGRLSVGLMDKFKIIPGVNSVEHGVIHGDIAGLTKYRRIRDRVIAK